jgi:hypothetical protein
VRLQDDFVQLLVDFAFFILKDALSCGFVIDKQIHISYHNAVIDTVIDNDKVRCGFGKVFVLSR